MDLLFFLSDVTPLSFGRTEGVTSAALYSLLGSAKLNGLDPELYLHHVLERVADHPISSIDDLLPWNVSLPTPCDPS